MLSDGKAKVCIVPGCGQGDRITRSFCWKHYMRQYHGGDPFSPSGQVGLRRDVTARFWARVAKLGDHECWEWQGWRVNGGYGRFKHERRCVYAHRFSYTLHFGSLADNLDVCHRCDNPSCVNPAHLFTGTHLDNMKDMSAKGRRSGNQYTRRAATRGAV